MADLQRIQNQMNQLSSLIQEVEAMPESADAETIKNKLLIWKSKTDAILEQEIDDYTREVEDFNGRWRMPMVGNTIKSAVIRKLPQCSHRYPAYHKGRGAGKKTGGNARTPGLRHNRLRKTALRTIELHYE